MESNLPHTVADIIRWLLITIGQGTDPNDNDTPELRIWPVHAKSEPDSPDDCITVYSTSGTLDGQSPHDSSLWDRHGWQVRVRGRTHHSGYQKANNIRNTLAAVYWQTITVQDPGGTIETDYRVERVNIDGQVNDLNREQPTSGRYVFTINGVATIDPNP